MLLSSPVSRPLIKGKGPESKAVHAAADIVTNIMMHQLTSACHMLNEKAACLLHAKGVPTQSRDALCPDSLYHFDHTH